uniref:Uncharacterized protein n=1 Tax=Arundo donax TaxID=35708 RepID=A0A0A8ZNY5_ARUDO
MVTQDPSWLND